MTYSIKTSCNVFSNNIIENQNTYFVSFVNEKLKEYTTYLESIGCDGAILQSVRSFSQSVQLSLLLYYAGSRWEAYHSFQEAIKYIPIDKMVIKMPQGNYYRARKPEKHKKLFSENEMFHIPFESRYKVKVQRYSYPGYPCLYLGSSVGVCCEELEYKNDDLNVAEFYMHSDNFRLLDMCFFADYDFKKLTEEQFRLFVQAWPLVQVCSFRYKNVSEMMFRPDYIISQMLLEYIVDKSIKDHYKDQQIICENQLIRGIRYCSVINFATRFQNGDFKKYMNYVLPSQEVKKEGFCPKLENAFECKEIIELKDWKN